MSTVKRNLTLVRHTDKSSVIDLGILRPSLWNPTKKYIGWTVSLPTRFKLARVLTNGRAKKRVPIKWEFLTPNQQLSFFEDTYIPKVIQPHVDNGIIVFEQTKQGNLHMHIMLHDDAYQNEYDMTALRASIRQSGVCIKISGFNMANHRRLNYIHYLEDAEGWKDYLNKDQSKHEFPIYTLEK